HQRGGVGEGGEADRVAHIIPYGPAVTSVLAAGSDVGTSDPAARTMGHAGRMRFSVWPSASQPWADLLATVRHAEETGWDGLCVPPPFMANHPPFPPALPPPP